MNTWRQLGALKVLKAQGRSSQIVVYSENGRVGYVCLFSPLISLFSLLLPGVCPQDCLIT